MKKQPDDSLQSPFFEAGLKNDIKQISKSGPSFFFH